MTHLTLRLDRMTNSAVRLLFADQLGPHFDDGGQVLIPEVLSPLLSRRYHRQKAHLILSALRHRAQELGGRAELVRGDSYHEVLKGRDLSVVNPTSRGLRSLLADLGKTAAMEVLAARGFAATEAEFADWRQTQGSKRLLMENFYRDRRVKTGVLMNTTATGELSPEGGKFNFDHENRQPPPKGQLTLGVASAWYPVEDEIDQEVRLYLDQLEADGKVSFIGKDGPRLFPATRKEALLALDNFVSNRLATFGAHEDAAMKEDWAMSHSLLSPAMNLGLLDPMEVVQAAERAYRAGGIELASAEGFIRQVMGWRDWVWHLYWHLGDRFETANYFQHEKPLPEAFQELDPGLLESSCLQQVIVEIRDRGWTHHINRLMVLGSFGVQRELDPQALNDWFIDAFVDGTPWVMPANVIGMSQYADGGLTATKPYTSGGAYVNKMTDYCKGCQFSPTVRVGEKACHFSAGYWNFLDKNKDLLKGNYRMAQPLAGLGRLSDLAEIRSQEANRNQF